VPLEGHKWERFANDDNEEYDIFTHQLLSATLHDEDTELNMHLTFELKQQHRGSIQISGDHEPKLLSSLLANSSTSTIVSEGNWQCFQ